LPVARVLLQLLFAARPCFIRPHIRAKRSR
jgi:hypothetical protein